MDSPESSRYKLKMNYGRNNLRYINEYDLQDKAYEKPSEILQHGDRDKYANEYNRILLQSKREKIDYQYPIMKTRNSINIDSASNEQARSIQSYLERKRLKEERLTIPSQNKMSRNAIERNKTIDNSIYQFTNSNQNPNEKRLDSISKLSQIINNNSFYDYIKRNNYHHLVDIGYTNISQNNEDKRVQI